MNEELLIKLKVDTSSITSSVNKIKNEVANVNKQVSNATGSANSESAAKSNDKLAKAMSSIEQSVGKIKSGISGWDVASAVVGAKAVNEAFDKAKESVGKLSNVLLNAFDGHLANTVKDVFKFDFKSAKIDFGEFVDSVKGKFKGLKSNISSIGSAFKTGGLKEGFTKLGSSIANATVASAGFKAALAAIKSVALAVGTAVSALVAALGALVIVAGVVAAFKVSKLGNEVYHSAQQFGFSTKAFQEWGYIMERNGSTVEDLKGYLETLGSEQAAVITGSEEAAQKFKNLGISAEEAVSMDSQKLFETTISKLQGIESSTERAAYAYELFGDEASRLMNVINMNNAEMQEMVNNYNLLGGSMSDRLIAQSNSLQASVSNMKQAWKGISNTLAEGFIPVVQKVVNWLTKAFVIVNLFLRSIFQLDLKPASDSANKAAASTNKYTGGIKAATKAAQELKRVTMGFDELNIVSDPNKSSGGDSGAGASAGGVGGGIDVDSLMPDTSSLNLDGIYEWFEKYKTVIKDVTAWTLTLVGIIGGVIALCFGNIPLGIGLLAMGGIGILAGLGEGGTWDRLVENIKTVFAPLGEFFKSVWNAITTPLKPLFNEIAGVFKEAWEIIKIIWDGVQPYFAILWEGIKGVFSVVVTYLGGMFKTAWEAIKAVWNVVVSYFTLVWAGIKAVFAVVRGILSGDFKGAWDAIKNVWDKAKAFFKSIWDGIKNVFAATANWFGNTFSAAWNAITKVFNKVGDFFTGVWKKIKSIFTNIGGSIGTAVSNALASAINWVLSKAVSIINGFVSAINAAIGVINKIPGVEIKKLAKLDVPKLATGGIATRSVLANIGEAGKEAVLPLENNTEWMDTLADKIAERNSSPSKIVLKVGEKEFAWAAINGINNVTKQTGSLQLAL